MASKTKVALLSLCSLAIAPCQTISAYVTPFQSVATGNAEIGKKVGIILNLQLWQTLRVPTSGPGRSSKGLVLWDIDSKPPRTYEEAGALAKSSPDDPQLVLWGKTWPFANQNVVEAFLLIRRDAERNRVGFEIWKAALLHGPTFAVDLPRWQVDFAPIVLRSDLLPELTDPAGLKLYTSPTGSEEKGYVGNSVRALEQDGDAAKVVLPSGMTGWVRLPNLSRDPTEVVDFTGAVVRFFRQDWTGASALFQRLVANSRLPVAVRIDSYLYLAVCADNTGRDSYEWTRKAYNLAPLSKTVIEYLCMSHLSALARMGTTERAGAAGTERLKFLNDIAKNSETLFSPQDSWFSKLRGFLANPR